MQQNPGIITDNDDINLTAEERAELEEAQPLAAAITFRSQDFDVAGLVRRLNNQDILIPRIGTPPEIKKMYELNSFQRGFVWDKKQMDLFIESLLLEYPIPGLFFVQQKDRRFIVLDGQQRLETLRRFYSGFNNENKYHLKLDNSQFDDMTYDTLPDRYRRILDNTYITTTIIILDDTPKSHDAVYNVFQRLNSGGTQLTPHEIRMALYNGKLMALIDASNTKEPWRKLYGSVNRNKRFRDHELILRIIALFLEESNYSKPLSNFLNQFAEKYRNGEEKELLEALDIFDKAAALLESCGIPNPFSLSTTKQPNNARADSIMVGCMHAIHNNIEISASSIDKLLKRLSNDADYENSVISATSDTTQVHKRIAIVRKVLSK